MHPTIQLALQEIERLGIKKWEFLCAVAEILGKDCTTSFRHNGYRYLSPSDENRVIPRPKIIAAMQKWIEQNQVQSVVEQ